MYYRYFSLSFLATLLLIAGNCRAIQAQAAASQNNVSGSATAGITSKDSAATSSPAATTAGSAVPAKNPAAGSAQTVPTAKHIDDLPKN